MIFRSKKRVKARELHKDDASNLSGEDVRDRA